MRGWELALLLMSVSIIGSSGLNMATSKTMTNSKKGYPAADTMLPVGEGSLGKIPQKWLKARKKVFGTNPARDYRVGGYVTVDKTGKVHASKLRGKYAPYHQQSEENPEIPCSHEIGYRAIGRLPGHPHTHPTGSQMCLKCHKTLDELFKQEYELGRFDKDNAPQVKGWEKEWKRFLCWVNTLSPWNLFNPQDVGKHPDQARLNDRVEEELKRLLHSNREEVLKEGKIEGLMLAKEILNEAWQDREMSDDPDDPRARVIYLMKEVNRYLSKLQGEQNG